MYLQLLQFKKKVKVYQQSISFLCKKGLKKLLVIVFIYSMQRGLLQPMCIGALQMICQERNIILN